jgi:hypothetical protein
MSARIPKHYHRWIPAPELGARHVACVCGALGRRNQNGRIVTDLRAYQDVARDDNSGDYTGGRCPTLDDYDAGRAW